MVTKQEIVIMASGVLLSAAIAWNTGYFPRRPRLHLRFHSVSLATPLPKGIFLAEEGLTHTVGKNQLIRFTPVNLTPSDVQMDVTFVCHATPSHLHRYWEKVPAHSHHRVAQGIGIECAGNQIDVRSVFIGASK